MAGDEYKITEEKPRSGRMNTPRQRKTMVVKANSILRASEIFNDISKSMKELSIIALPGLDIEEQMRMCCLMLKSKKDLDEAGKLIIESRRRFYEEYGIEMDAEEEGFSSEESPPYQEDEE